MSSLAKYWLQEGVVQGIVKGIEEGKARGSEFIDILEGWWLC